MLLKVNHSTVVIDATPEDTYAWAHRPGMVWPCSTLSDKRVAATFDRNGLCELDIFDSDNRLIIDFDGPAHELNAFCADVLTSNVPFDHPAYDVAVGQFSKSVQPMEFAGV